MDKESIIRNFVIAASAAIPVVGGATSVILDKYLPNKVEERKNKILENIQNDLENIDFNILKNKLDNEEFYTVFLKVLNRSIANHRIEKLKAFRNILINNILSEEKVYDEVSFFIRLTDELTIDQIRILNFFYNAYFYKDQECMEVIIKNSSSMQKIMKSMWKDIDDDYLTACTTELLRFWLITGSIKSKKNTGIDSYSLSSLGERYVKWIFSPIYMDMFKSEL